jgi:hypothetical protein
MLDRRFRYLRRINRRLWLGIHTRPSRMAARPIQNQMQPFELRLAAAADGLFDHLCDDPCRLNRVATIVSNTNA